MCHISWRLAVREYSSACTYCCFEVSSCFFKNNQKVATLNQQRRKGRGCKGAGEGGRGGLEIAATPRFAVSFKQINIMQHTLLVVYYVKEYYRLFYLTKSLKLMAYLVKPNIIHFLIVEKSIYFIFLLHNRFFLISNFF